MTNRLRSIVQLLNFMVGPIAYCEIPAAYVEVASVKGIPTTLLYAIAETESLYGDVDPVSDQTFYGPWPWSLNVDKQAIRFSRRVDAYHALNSAVATQIPVDVGLMQIAWRWHHHRFQSTWEALDPYTNLVVGADILLEQYKRTGDWWVAVGTYHAPGIDRASKQRAEQYRQRVKKRWLLAHHHSHH